MSRHLPPLRDSHDRLQDVLCDYVLSGDQQSAFVALLDVVIDSSASEFGFVAEVVRDEETDLPYLLTRSLSDIAWDDPSRLTLSRAMSGGMRFDNLDSLFGHVVTSEQIVLSNDSLRDLRSSGTPSGHPLIHSFLGLPVMAQGVLVGVIGLANRDGGYEPADAARLDSAVRAAAALIIQSRREHERRQRTSDMQEARDRAEGAAAAKGFFLSRMSHELRTPLNAMLGFAQLIQIRAQTDRDRRDAGRIVSAGRHLMALLDEVMDVSSIEEGRITLQLQTVDLMEAVSECLSLVEAAAHERDVRLLIVPTKESRDDEPVLVDVDPSRLRQVILNLLDNAVKYNRPGGSVRLHVEVVEGRAILEVHDEGRGISEEGRDRVFEPFERLDASLLGVRGSGLGLSVARSLARAMSGDVQLVSSRPGNTIFRVTMLASDESMPRSIEAQALDPSLDVVGHVLYVEDHPMNALLVRSILEHAVPRVTVEVARSGKEALDILKSRTPNLVLLDLHLPDMSGLDVLSQSGIAQRTPVHVVTADVTVTARERAAEASVHGYVLKPVSPKALVDCVVSALRAPENRQNDQEGPDADADADSR